MLNVDPSGKTVVAAFAPRRRPTPNNSALMWPGCTAVGSSIQPCEAAPKMYGATVAPPVRPAERVRPLELAAQRRAFVGAERAERIGGGGLKTIERKLLCDEQRMTEARLRLADQGALQIVGQRLRPGRVETRVC